MDARLLGIAACAGDCPLAQYRNFPSGWVCNHPAAYENAIEDDEIPDWCPLRAAPLVLAIAPRDDNSVQSKRGGSDD